MGSQCLNFAFIVIKFYVFLSAVVSLFPFGWMIWITVHYETSVNFVFLWIMNIAYLFSYIALLVVIKNKLTMQLILYAYMLLTLYSKYAAWSWYSDENETLIALSDAYERQMPIIAVIYAHFQQDIALL